ncbi:hypothetical protein SAMN04489760_103188 [Syntrophus gentianae]|uniref:VPLPA-CTERM protein sorting domain-containing protein n=1 Tax=Syntrophus gentianae TaxID=43775 RepID=A0A1H7VEA0_9BACT|nr:PEP-CTERM sorting domain-containing protein [Syntrophus gentianae]SEM07209.1 hypothetical protein SAMN04489760_103188 [Syntrophus gentianae]
MRRFGLSRFFALVLILALFWAPSIALSATTYDLATNWSKIDNPNGTWAVWKGSELLQHQVGDGSPMTAGMDFFAMGNEGGNFLPAWWQGTNDNIYTHSWDSANGGSPGESILTWTAPEAGTISLSGCVWYDHAGVNRSNDFSLYLGSTLLASGTISYASHNGEANALTFYDALVTGQTLTDLAVSAGDTVSLWIVQSQNQTYGSVAGVELTITETAAPVPLPGALFLFGPGLAGLAIVKRKLNK